MNVLQENGYKHWVHSSNSFVKEWDEQSSTKQTDTAIIVWVAENKISKVKFMTDKFASTTGSYYTCKIEFPEPVELSTEFLMKLEHCINRVSQGALKEIKEQFNAEPEYHQMH